MVVIADTAIAPSRPHTWRRVHNRENDRFVTTRERSTTPDTHTALSRDSRETGVRGCSVGSARVPVPHRLHHAAELPIEECAPLGHAGAVQGHRHRKTCTHMGTGKIRGMEMGDAT
jgi:hypothetical protein